jgi:carboxypeptidase T
MVINGLITFLFLFSQNVMATPIWMEIRAQNQEERTALASQGYDIVAVEEDRVVVLGSETQLQKAQQAGKLLARYVAGLSPFDFPQADQKFHNYQELTSELQMLAQTHSDVMKLMSLGLSKEGREIWLVRLSATDAVKPASLLMGGHHAREHVSVEVPLLLVGYLVSEYQKQNPRIVALLNNYEIFIVPVFNPDGKEFDVATGKYQQWRKNRSQNADGTYGVDLNRNYGYGWGGAGASTSTSDETYRGPSAFSEKETQALKRWIEQTPQVKTLLSYHTFSQLVMWPWGHQKGKINDANDLRVFENMGKKMASFNGYRPMKSGDLYLASGDTCDWAYGEHGIFAFTFELDPRNFWEGGFYPGASVIDSVFQKNIEPTLYLIEASDNPYKHL